MSTCLLIAAGGVLGANARYAISVWAVRRLGASFPYGTFLINLSGSFLIGLIVTLLTERFDDDAEARALVVTGFLGSYTTFSTFTFEAIALLRRGAVLPALTYVLGSAGLGVAGATGGVLLAALVDRALT